MRIGEVLEPDEITARKTHKGADDYAFERERADRRKKPEAPPNPQGNCCATCPHWHPPPGKGVYGSCRIAFATKRDGIVNYDEAKAMSLMGAEELRTAPGFTCSQWGRVLQREPIAAPVSLRSLVRREAS